MTARRHRRRHRPRFLVVDGCPAPYSVAPYIYVVTRAAKQTASSIYRGSDAAGILHRHGKRTQAEIHRDMPAISNPPGLSEHELRSDGADGSGIPRGERLPDYMVGVDSGGDDDADREAVHHAARIHGWRIVHPYKRGVEGHHWRFSEAPHPHSLRMRARIIYLRARLPRR
jgi:hypothetical protein